MKQFIHDPNYLARYFIGNIVVFSTLIGILFITRGISLTPFTTWFTVLLVPLGGVCGLIISTVFHNAAHRNIRPLWLNEILGEFAGAYTLEGMRNFRVGHMLHHMHADHPELDPHAPGSQSFLHFLTHSKGQTIDCLQRLYIKSFGDTKQTRTNLELQILCHHAATGTKVLFWYFLLGPTFFIYFFLPSLFAYFLGFGHLNYISHRQDSDGEVLIQDSTIGWYYRAMNFVTAGGYFHKSHHDRPWLYNPSQGRVD